LATFEEKILGIFMKITLSLLKEFLDIDISPSEIASLLTSVGIEVEKIFGEKIGFSNVVAAKVLSVTKHPTADKLVIAEVSDGTETYQIVCGAANCRKDLLTALAKISAKLTTPEGESFTIKKSNLRGVESFGMLCSAKELNLAEEAEGILELPQEIPLGSDLSTLFYDPIFEISLTPNLGHCMSALGIARELSALTQKHIRWPSTKVDPSSNFSLGKDLSVKIEEDKACLRYSAKVLKNIELGSTSFWLKTRLEACGYRSIHPIVDVLNYVMLECGQPMHAFDLDELEKQSIVVRFSKPQEKLLTLDGIERTLPEKTLIIADLQKPLAIAGIMGGSDSAIKATTKNIVLEAAFFDPITIRLSAKKLGIKTESSNRFEKSVNPNGLNYALERASFLIHQMCKGKISETLDFKKQNFDTPMIDCRLKRINEILGTKLSFSEVESFFHRLNFPIRSEDNDTFKVCIPTFRHDITSEIDLIEDLAKLYGYTNFERKNPSFKLSANISHDPLFSFEKNLKEKLVSSGLQECITCNLLSPKLANLSENLGMEKRSYVQVQHYASEEYSVLRPSLFSSLIPIVKFNQDHETHNLALFEIGQIHYKKEDRYIEQSMVAILLKGLSRQNHWERKPKEFDFFDLKGILENLFLSLGISHVDYKISHHPLFHPGRQCEISVDKLELGTFGEIHPSILSNLGIKDRVYYAEISENSLVHLSSPLKAAKPLSLFPSSTRDWTITWPLHAPIHLFFDSLKQLSSSLLENIELLDIYHNEDLGEDKKNVTFRFTYRDLQKTVSFEEVEKEHLRILTILKKHLEKVIT
jgi:phenylalanyl-tRNA synthetase beta chain